MMPIVGITGATGFVGSHMCKLLHDRGYSLRLLLRSTPNSLPDALLAQSQLVFGSLQDPSALLALCSECDVIIHCAASVRGNTWDDFESTNVQGTARLIAAMEQQGCQYYLHVSSLAATQPQLSWYSRSKHAAEQLVQQSALPGLILRPPAIYGPGDRELRPLLDMLYRGGPVLRVTSPDQQLALLHVDDLCAAMLACVQQRVQGLYSLDDGTEEGYDWDSICAAVQQLSGRTVRTLQLPASVLHSMAYLNVHWSRWRGRKSMLNPGKARELCWSDWRTPAPRLQQVLDWQPAFTLPEGLRTLYQQRPDQGQQQA
jgi:nucleoside-diphosphate-sugar epimerase